KSCESVERRRPKLQRLLPAVSEVAAQFLGREVSSVRALRAQRRSRTAYRTVLLLLIALADLLKRNLAVSLTSQYPRGRCLPRPTIPPPVTASMSCFACRQPVPCQQSSKPLRLRHRQWIGSCDVRVSHFPWE